MAQVRRYISNTGKITFSAPHSKDGHADITSGICLGVEAGAQNPECFATPNALHPYSVFGTPTNLFG